MVSVIKCSKCQNITSDFGWQDKAHTKPQVWCRGCFRKNRLEARRANPEPSRTAARTWYNNNRELVKVRSKKWRDSNDSKVRRHKVRQSAVKFGLNPTDVLAYYDKHSGMCDICNRPANACFSPPHRKRLSVEHSHKLYLFRGLVCDDCNQMLKFAHDDPVRLQTAINYLNAPPGSLS